MWPKTKTEWGEQLTLIGNVLFWAAAFLFGVPGCTDYAIWTIAATAATFAAAIIILIQIKRFRWHHAWLTLLAFLIFGPWWFFMAGIMFGRPAKPNTEGFAELYVSSKQSILHLDLPAGWYARYRGRDLHEPHEAYLIDQYDQTCIDVYASCRSLETKSLETIAQQTLDQWQAIADAGTSDIRIVDSEFRDGPNGKVWLAKYHHPHRDGHGVRDWGDNPVMGMCCHTKLEPRLLTVEFHMLAVEAGELEPIAWKIFQTARLDQPTNTGGEDFRDRVLPQWVGAYFVCVVLAGLVTPLIVFPSLVYTAFRIRMPPTIDVVDPHQQSLPPDAQSRFDEADRDLTAEGFDLIATLSLPDMISGVEALFSLYTNRAECDLAASVIHLAKDGESRELRLSYVEFVRRYDDNILVQTNNALDLGSFKRMPGTSTFPLWEIQDVHRLYHLHQVLADRLGQGKSPVNPVDV